MLNSNSFIKKYVISIHSEEFRNVKSLFSQSCSFSVQSITRIQNVNLWNKFEAERKNLQQKLGKPSQQLDLWHGCKNSPSSSIIYSSEGFDKKFSGNGSYGHGNYFAIKSSYSAGSYCYHNSDGTRGIFLAKVLIGEPATTVDSSRRMPPLKENGVRYDSVTNYSDMYVVYSNCKAYPMYYVTFK